MDEEPESHSAILRNYLKSTGMSGKKAAKAARSYDRIRRVKTPCAKERGSNPYRVSGKVLFNATRGSRVQVMNGTAHHTCSGLRKGAYMRHPKTGAIVSVKKRQAGLKRWRMMDKATKAKFMSNAGRGFGPRHGYNLRKTVRGKNRVNYKGMEKRGKDETGSIWDMD